MATLASRGRGASLQAGPYGSLPGASVPSVSQVGGQAGGSLRLGDVVLLYAQDKKSYVFSDISSNVIQSVAVCPVVPPFQQGDPNLPDTHGACFRVLSANKYKAQEHLSHLKQELSLKSKQKLSPQDRERLKAAERNVKTENVDNAEEQQRIRGNTVAYGIKIQLQHVFTGKYLCVNSSQTSALESTNLRMELSPENSQNCIFKILPRYKVRSVGDEVLMNDQVIFESTKTEGQYLHCSANFFGKTGQQLHSKYHEVNLSATESAFTIVPHFCPKEDTEKKDVLRAGNVVRLFHREMECYLVAEGSFADIEEVGVVENVHLRKRKTDRGRLKAPSTSAITYWSIEKQREPLSGEALHWRELCRIQHLPTRQYLAVVKDQDGYKVTLKERSADTEFEADTTFRLVPVIEDDDDVIFGSYARIYHLHTDSWLHALKANYVKQSATEVDGLQWDGGEHFCVSASQQMCFDDAFSLMMVSPDLVSKFNFVAGMVPILQAYVAERKQARKLTQKRAAVMEEALSELVEFMTDPYARCKDHQKLVRNLRVLELLVSFPKLLDQQKSESDRMFQQRVCRAGYKVIEVFLYGDSRKNELYLSGFIPLFEAQVKVGLNAEDILVELVRDNLRTVSTFTVPKINNIIRWLLEGEKKDCRFFDYLGVLCVCEGKAVVSTQDLILSELVYKHQDLFFQTKVMPDNGQPGNPKRVFFQDRESGEWRHLTEIAHKTLAKKTEVFSTPWKLLEAQLGLFAKLAKGNNTRAIKAITEELCCVTFDEALAGAGDPELHPTIRSKYVELLIVLFVDVGDNHSVLETLANSFVYSELQANPFEEEEDDIALSLTGVRNQYIAPLRDWLLKVVKSNQVLVCSEEMILQNTLLAEILGLLEMLVNYGYYDNLEDIKNVVHPLIAMLDGRTDVPHARGTPSQADLAKFKEDTRFKASPANRAVFAVKYRIMKIFEFLFNYRVHLRLVGFICEYRTLMSESGLRGKRGHSRVRRRVDPSQAVSVNIHEPVAWASDTISSPLLDEGKGKGRQNATATRSKKSPPAELRELQNEEGKEKSRQRKHLGPVTRKHLGDIMKPTSFFEDGATHARDQAFVQILLDTASHDDADLVVWSMHLLNRFFSAEADVFENATNAQLLVTESSASSLKLVDSQVAAFRKITQLELDVSLMAELEEILEKLRRLCVLDEVLREPNCQNQRILLNSGVLNDVLNLILHRLKGSIFVQTSDHEQKGKLEEEQAKENLSRKAFQFMTALARGHRPVQEQLFAQVDALLDTQFGIQDMALVIKEVFTNYHELCVKLQESQVEQVFRLITKCEQSEQAALLQALKSMTITRVESIDLPVKRNQDLVTKFFCRSREFFNPILGQDASDSDKRLHIVSASADDDPRLLVLLSVVDLLAACCKGRNVFVQSICQTIVSSDELLQLLCSDQIAISRKLPFCLYLVWVYLDADLLATQTHNTLNLKDPHLFQYMQRTCDVVTALVHELPHIKPTEEMVSHLRYTHFGAEETHASGDKVSAEAAGWLPPGVLTYFLDGILPLLWVYCQQSFEMLSTTEEKDTMQLLRSLATTLLESVQVVQPVLGNANEAVLLRDALLMLTSSPGVDHYLQVPTEVRELVKQFIDGAAVTKSSALMAFVEEFSEELQLNTTFNQFVSAYEDAYNGPNTLQHQLGVKNKFIKDEAYSTMDDGPGYLPLGPGFQKFVSCFVRRDQSTCRVLPTTANLIRQLDVSFNMLEDLTDAEQARQDGLDLKCLQVLRAIIYHEIVRIDPELKENQPKAYRRLATKIVKAQNAVQQLGGNTAAKVIPMLIHPNDEVGAEVLAFLSVFMYDGNKVVQAGCEFLCHRKEGQFLAGIKTRLELAVAISRENRALRAQLLTRQSENQKLMEIYKGEMSAQKQRVTLSHSRQSGIARAYDSGSESEGEQEELDGQGIEMRDLSRQHDPVDPMERDSAESLAFHDPTHVQLTLQVLGLMCDGQNRNLQNFFRDQPASISNVNLIGEVATFAQHYYSNIRHSNMQLVMQVLQTLVEVCVGNYYNQDVIFDCQIVDLLNHILQLGSIPGCAAEEMLDLKASAVELLEVMLEDTHEDTPKLARNVLKSLDIEAVHDTLVYFYHMQSDKEMLRLRKDDDAQRALFKTFHVLKHLCDFEGVAREKLIPSEPAEDDEEHQRKSEILKVWKYCSEQSKSVEVLYENLDGEKVLSKVHYRYDPDDQLSEEMVEKVKWQVSRESAEDKVRDFLEWMKAVKGIVQHTNTLRDHWYTKVFIYRRNIWHWAYIFLTILLNILVLVAWKDPADPTNPLPLTSRSIELNNPNSTRRSGFGLPTIPAVEFWFGYYLLFILGGLHFIMTLKIVFTYFLVNWPNFYFIPSFFYTIRGKERDESYADVAFVGPKTLYFLLLLSWSGLSLGFWGYFYPLCLVHIVVNNDILQRVLRSVTKNWRSLFWVAMLGLVVLYIYGLVSYAAFQTYFDDPESGSHCRTLFQCVVSVIRLGLIGGGGLVTNADAAFTDPVLVSFFPAYIPRTIFDVSFFAIVTTVGLGVIFGIIIDTFSELRDEKYKAEADRRDFCFICNIPAYEFDRKSQGFAHHVDCEHNMWDYIYFSLELDRTDSSDQNAIQFYVHKQIQERSPRFFPVLKARCFGHDEDETNIRLTSMEDNIQKILDRFENEEKMTAKLQFFREEQDAWEQSRK